MLLEIMLSAKGNDEECWEDDGGVDNEENAIGGGTGDGRFELGPRMIEVSRRRWGLDKN